MPWGAEEFGPRDVLKSSAPRRAHARTTLEQVWEATGPPECAGLNVWQPYERLDWDTQEAMLHAAATALQLAGEGRIAPRGRLGAAPRPAVHQHVYDCDRPGPCPVTSANVISRHAQPG